MLACNFGNYTNYYYYCLIRSTYVFLKLKKFAAMKKPILYKGTIVYFFDGRSPSKHKLEFLHLAGALMEHFLEGMAPLRYLYINPNEKSNK